MKAKNLNKRRYLENKMEIITTKKIIDDRLNDIALDKRYGYSHYLEDANKRWVTIDDILDFIKGYETPLGDLPKELNDLKEKLSQK